MRNKARGALQGASRSERGQALVEFGLVLPLLLVILLGVADFGRVFQAGIAEEAAVRNAAEAAAEQYVQFLECGVGNPDPLCGGLPDPAQYDTLHTEALEVACREAERIPGRMPANWTSIAVSGNCTMPITAVCIHDNSAGDSSCGAEAASAPADCTEMNDPWSPAPDPSRPTVTDGTDSYFGRPYVEVRMCYRFDPLFSFALGSWGSIWMQKTNYFVVTNY